MRDRTKPIVRAGDRRIELASPVLPMPSAWSGSPLKMFAVLPWSELLDSIDFRDECPLNVLGMTSSTRHSAHVRRIHAEISSNACVDARIQPVPC
jgi:hypothetical protein